MGWCSGTRVFDMVCEILLDEGPLDRRSKLKSIIQDLENSDWDCQQDSDYWDHPLVREIFEELHPIWFDDE